MPEEQKHPLSVVVTGTTKSGKTTLARIIAMALRDAGFEVVNTDPDDQSKQGLYPMEKDRIKTLAKGKRVRVSTVQTTERQ